MALIQALTLLHWFAFKLDHFHADDEQKCIVVKEELWFGLVLHCTALILKSVIFTLFLSFIIDHKQKPGMRKDGGHSSRLGKLTNFKLEDLRANNCLVFFSKLIFVCFFSAQNV